MTFALILWIFTFTQHANAQAPPGEPIETETKARTDDASAVASYKAALSKLEVLKSRYKGKPQEAARLSLRIMETYTLVAAIEFRLSHATVQVPGAVQEYRRALDNIITTSSEFLRDFPKSPDVARATFLRAKASRSWKRMPKPSPTSSM